MLFVDVSGFGRMVRSLDPYGVYTAVGPVMDDLVRLVHRYGGDVQQVLGDGFMAVFGLGAVRTDEAERAVRAGLAAVAAGAPGGTGALSLAVHAGLEYGEVLVAPGWGPASFSVWGRAVVYAKRLCDLAGPGELRVGPAARFRAGTTVNLPELVPSRRRRPPDMPRHGETSNRPAPRSARALPAACACGRKRAG